MRNIEIKAKVKDVAALIEKAQNISHSGGIVIKQDDTFFKVIQGRLKLRRFEVRTDKSI